MYNPAYQIIHETNIAKSDLQFLAPLSIASTLPIPGPFVKTVSVFGKRFIKERPLDYFSQKTLLIR